MAAERLTPEQIVIGTTEVIATGVVAAEAILLKRDPMVDILAFYAVYEAFGVPATPMIETVKTYIKNLQGKK